LYSGGLAKRRFVAFVPGPENKQPYRLGEIEQRVRYPNAAAKPEDRRAAATKP
jgi:hypothetical protein